MFSKSEVHCQYCMCPKEAWKGGNFKTYHGDECKLYSDFSDVISDLEYAEKPFNNYDILKKCREDFAEEYNDITDFEAIINEMINIYIELGVMSEDYRPISIK